MSKAFEAREANRRRFDRAQLNYEFLRMKVLLRCQQVMRDAERVNHDPGDEDRS